MNATIFIISLLAKNKPIDFDYSGLSEEIKTNPKAPKFKFGDRVRITKWKNNFSKSHTKNWFREIFVIDSMLKTNPWTYKINDLYRTKKSYYTYNQITIRLVRLFY